MGRLVGARGSRFWIKNYNDRRWHFVQSNRSQTAVVRVIRKGRRF